MGSRISLVLTIFLAIWLPAQLFFKVNKVQGWLAVIAQATLILWPILTMICLFRINYSNLRFYDEEDDFE